MPIAITRSSTRMDYRIGEWQARGNVWHMKAVRSRMDHGFPSRQRHRRGRRHGCIVVLLLLLLLLLWVVVVLSLRGRQCGRHGVAMFAVGVGVAALEIASAVAVGVATVGVRTMLLSLCSSVRYGGGPGGAPCTVLAMNDGFRLDGTRGYSRGRCALRGLCGGIGGGGGSSSSSSSSGGSRLCVCRRSRRVT